jgi:uncharacterized repeat protein (TIGR03803 family)
VRISYFGRYALSICVAAAFLAGCGGSQPPIGAPGVAPQTPPFSARTSSTNYKVVYSFGGSPDGKNPVASLIDVGGKLYGTTENGGSRSSCQFYPSLCGTVFSITPSGREKVLHTFGAEGDGRNPIAGLINVGGTLYGTTEYGGSGYCYGSEYEYGCGTVFSITPSGTEKVLYTLNGYGDASLPIAGLIDVGGTLYGTTHEGGVYNIGSAFSITPSGKEKVLHSFGQGFDGFAPEAALLHVGRRLYGTTTRGGTYGGGTVFRITLSGKEKVLHRFGKGTDGRQPFAGLTDVSGTFYGTTRQGGAHGSGTVFSITPFGTEKVLYSFGGGSDGKDPIAGVTEMNGELYGTTELGGAHDEGTVYRISTTGAETVVYSFGSGDNDGRHPYAGLLKINDTLYGTTTSGGMAGWGTVFSLKP